MCGPKYCSMKITEEIRAMNTEEPLVPLTQSSPSHPEPEPVPGIGQ
jgi:hypothetical protein